MAGASPDQSSILDAVRARIDDRKLTARLAAGEIGIGLERLVRHLGGDYVRSDSLAKYRRWLEGATPSLAVTTGQGSQTTADSWDVLARTPLPRKAPARENPAIVVDLFSGCGGMSLGFDLISGHAFETVLAIDTEAAMVRAFNANTGAKVGRSSDICRRVDLADFVEEAEVLAFYLDHLAQTRQDSQLRGELEQLPLCGLGSLVAAVREADKEVLEALRAQRSTPEYRRALAQMPSHVLGQTSVIGFLSDLALPLPSATDTSPLVWSSGPGVHSAPPLPTQFDASLLRGSGEAEKHLSELWDSKVRDLTDKAQGMGQGQLASSAARIGLFLEFLQTDPMQSIRAIWLHWRSRRDALRFGLFGNDSVRSRLRHLYAIHGHVDVLLGGPPCQGFSRIGRGKIRSLREHSVQVHYDAVAGDERNRLLFAYVLFVSALAPRVFLFENVRHFQAEVRTPEGTFLASQVLEEAIRDLSDGHLRYQVSTRILHAVDHLVPQLRERFFLAGVSDELPAAQEIDAASWILALARSPRLPLRLALEGLPEPKFLGASGRNQNLAQTVDVSMPARGSGPEADFRAWVVQPAPAAPQRANRLTDAHSVRPPRGDDRELFALMGPGKRWMDYRSDSSSTVSKLRAALQLLLEAREASEESPRSSPVTALLNSLDQVEARRLVETLDGSLSLRLLLESIQPEPGELEHHLLSSNYLAKRDGNHGDWLARLDGERPSKTIVSHMGKDTYAYVHPYEPRTLSVREAARIQSFPDWFSLGSLSLVDAFRVVGNAVPPILSHQLAARVAEVLGAGARATISETRQTELAEFAVTQ